MNAAARFGRGHSLDAVDAALKLQARVGASTVNLEDDLLQAADAGFVRVVDFDGPAMPLGIAGVHPEEVRREERGLLAPGAGPDLDDHVFVIVRIARGDCLAELGVEISKARAQRVQLFPNEGDHLKIGLGVEHLLCFGDSLGDRLALAVQRDCRLDA